MAIEEAETPMPRGPSDATPLRLVARIAAALPSLSGPALEDLADAVEALTDAIGLQREWPEKPHAAHAAVDVVTTVFPDIDLSRWSEPDDTGDERADLVRWLEYQRHEFLRKLRDLSADELVDWSVPPVELSVLGLVRHMRQMEAGYLTWGLTGHGESEIYGQDDFAGGSVDSIDEDLHGWSEEVQRANRAIASLPSLDSPGLGHGRTLRWTLRKMLHEYTLHAGQAHMLRFAALGTMKR